MAEKSEITAQVQNRRAFVKTAAKVAVTAPAAAILLNASTKPAKAITNPYETGLFDDLGFGGDFPPDGDFTFTPGDDTIL